MIYAKFENIEDYFQKGSPIFKALSFALAFDSAKPDGRYEIDDMVHALVSSYDTSPATKRWFEAHRKYTDVHVILEGEEKIEVASPQHLEIIEEYSETKDVIFLGSPPDFASLPISPGCFAVFYPHDIHRPNCDLHGKRHVRKIVMKVRF
jgi:biofilm protein TabA